MAVRTKEELIEILKKKFGEETGDEVLGIYEDVSDTFDSFSGGEDWKAKYEENDRTWRQRYRDRFLYRPEDKDEWAETEDKELVEKTYKYEDLFEEKKEDEN